MRATGGEGLVNHLSPFDALTSTLTLTLTKHYIKRSDDYWLSKRWDVDILPDARLQLWTETLAAFGCDDPRVAGQTLDA